MITLDLSQGTPEWHAHRANHYNASEAPATLGCSPYIARDELIHALKTGDRKEFSEFVRRYILEKGHKFEALARPIAEQIIGEALFTPTGTNGKFSASFDGLTMDDCVAFEHKSLNDDIRALIDDAAPVLVIPVDGVEFALKQLRDVLIYHKVQMEHQLMVCDGEKCLFIASQWSDDGQFIEGVYYWHTPDMALRQAIIDGWEQIAKDVEAYQPEIIEQPAIPAPVANLPAIVVDGNIFPDKAKREEYTEIANKILEPTRHIPTNSQEAGDLLAVIERAKEAEANFKTFIEKTNVSESEKDAFRKWLADMLKAFARGRIDGTNNTEAFKTNEKTAMVNAASAALREYVKSLNDSLTKPFMPQVNVDFWSVVKSKSNPKNMQSDINALLAEKKIEANKVAEQISGNLSVFSEIAGEYAGLFDDDLNTLCAKDSESFAALVKMRIFTHKEAEAERERIRAEEQARADSEALARQQAEQAAPEPATVPVEPAKTAAVAQPVLRTVESVAANDSGERITLGQINTRLAPIQLSADGLRSLGFEFVATERAAKLYRSGDFPAICDALIKHIQAANLRKAA